MAGAQIGALARLSRQAWPLAALVLATAVAASPLLAPGLSVMVTTLALGPAASAAAVAPSGPAVSDPKIVLEDLAEDPVLRASRAVYEAAVLAWPPGRAPFTPRVEASETSHASILHAVALVDSLLRPRPAELAMIQASRARRPDLQATIARAAAAAGVDQAFLVHTAVRESGLNPYARASTSSGRGLFQFVDQTWLQAVARWGGRYGRKTEARRIQFDARRRAFVADRKGAQEILALRYEPELAARLAAAMAAENAVTLRQALGRGPSGGELYAAHLLGSAAAVRLIRAASIDPSLPAVQLLPGAAAANPRLFYGNGRPRSVSELLLSWP